MKDHFKKTVTLRTFTFPHEAHLAKAQLESNGVSAFVQDQYLVGMNLWYSQAIGGVKLQILESDIELAEKILDSKNQCYQSEANDQCPKCNSIDIRYFNEKKWQQRGILSLLSFFLLGLPWIFQSKFFLCNSCGYSGKYKELGSDKTLQIALLGPDENS